MKSMPIICIFIAWNIKLPGQLKYSKYPVADPEGTCPVSIINCVLPKWIQVSVTLALGSIKTGVAHTMILSRMNWRLNCNLEFKSIGKIIPQIMNIIPSQNHAGIT
jgi:hypothetical protein